MLLQRIWVPGHTCLLQVLPLQHAPSSHTSPELHVSPQPPQFAGSSVVFTQLVPQQVRPAPQPVVWQVSVGGTHTPALHVSPCAQALPHVPQLLGFVFVSTSQPFCSMPSQSAKPGAQTAILQDELLQTLVPFGTSPQTMPQPPQFRLSELSTAHVAPQQDSPLGHVSFGPQGPTHTAPEHCSPAAQAFPHPPQLLGSLLVSTSQPSCTWWSQSANPGKHPASSQVLAAQPAMAFTKGPHTSPHPPQLLGSVVVSTQSGPQHDRPLAHALPLPQKPTQRKLSHCSPLGHSALVRHCTQVPSFVSQNGVGDAHCAFEVQPPGTGTHMCEFGSQRSPEGHWLFEVQPLFEPPAPPPPSPAPSRELRPQPIDAVAALSANTHEANEANEANELERRCFVIEGLPKKWQRQRRKEERASWHGAPRDPSFVAVNRRTR